MKNIFIKKTIIATVTSATLLGLLPMAAGAAEVVNNKSNVDNHVSTDAEKEKDKFWKKEGDSWSYDPPLEDKVTGWIKFSYGNKNKLGHHEEWYHFNENGIMDKNTTIVEDGNVYEFREDGTLKNVPESWL